MFMRRSMVMAMAALALAGCAAGSNYSDGGYYGPYYGGGYGYDNDYHHDRYFRPERGVVCDRSRDACYDRHGLNQEATRRYFGDHRQDQDHSPGGRPAYGIAPGGHDPQHQQQIWPTQRQGLADNDGRPVGMPRLMNPNGKDNGSGGGRSCPPTGCR